METPLAKALVTRSITANQLAEIVDCDKGHLSNILNGKIVVRVKDGVPVKKSLSRAGAELARKIVLALGNTITEHQVIYPEDYDAELGAAVREAEQWNAEQSSVAA